MDGYVTMNEEQLDKTAEEVVRRLIATSLINPNEQRRAFGIVKQALEATRFDTQATINKFFGPE